MLSRFKQVKFISTEYLRQDLSASVVVFLVAFPLCLGIAMASGVSLFSGLISGMVGGLIVGALSGSHVSVSGPAAGLTAIVAGAITELGSFPGFLVAVVIAGVLQIALGFLRAGAISNYFPLSVIKGMLAAIGIILILKQIPHAVGYDADYVGDFSFIQVDNENSFTEIINAVNKAHPGAIIISLLSLSVYFIINNTRLKDAKWAQAPLIVVVLGILLNLLFDQIGSHMVLRDHHLVVIPVAKDIGDFFSFFMQPNWRFISQFKVWEIGVTIAVVASLQTLLSLDAIDKLDEDKRQSPPNRELVAQGIGNIVCGLIGGLPVIAEIVRSSANIGAGAKTKLSTLFHGVFLLSCFILIPGILNMIPLSCLAAILLLVGYRLCKPSVFISVYKAGWNQFLPFILTILSILFTDLLKGIVFGLALGIIFVVKREIQKGVFFYEEEGRGSKLKVYMLAEEVSFLSKASILKGLNKVQPNAKIIIDGTRSKYIDYDVLVALKDFQEKAKRNNIKVEFINVKDSY